MGSFWKKAWQGSGSGRVSFLGRKISGLVSLEWRSGGYREKNQRRRRGEEREFFLVTRGLNLESHILFGFNS
jgi:hypothetical protein